MIVYDKKRMLILVLSYHLVNNHRYQNRDKKIFLGDKHDFISFANHSDGINNQTPAHLSLN